jgi:DNA polymerase elongation subunit (family B)
MENQKQKTQEQEKKIQNKQKKQDKQDRRVWIHSSHIHTSSLYDGDDGDIAHFTAEFVVQLFGVTDDRQSCSIVVTGFRPFLYILCPDQWTGRDRTKFIDELRGDLVRNERDVWINGVRRKPNPPPMRHRVCENEHESLYGFTNGEKSTFIELEFDSVSAFNRVKAQWYTPGDWKSRTLLPNGHRGTRIFESGIPPLIRFFHALNAPPTGWVSLNLSASSMLDYSWASRTHCSIEYETPLSNITALSLADRPYLKIMSFDIEANSSHGDFPVPKKTYQKLASDIMESIEHLPAPPTRAECDRLVRRYVDVAFGIDTSGSSVAPDSDPDSVDTLFINVAYPKHSALRAAKLVHGQNGQNARADALASMCTKLIRFEVAGVIGEAVDSSNAHMDTPDVTDVASDEIFDGSGDGSAPPGAGDLGAGDDASYPSKGKGKGKGKAKSQKDVRTWQEKVRALPALSPDFSKDTLSLLCGPTAALCPRSERLSALTAALDNTLPCLEGDQVTMVGSTFAVYGESEPTHRHCAMLNTCTKDPHENAVTECFDKEADMLLAWTDMVIREDPDIIIGYNIFGFDYSFMHRRSLELGCAADFLTLSRNKFAVCGTENRETGELDIRSMTTKVASGQYELNYIDIPGRIQIDMLNFFRKTVNLESYTLDSVAGHFIGDTVALYDAPAKKPTIKKRKPAADSTAPPKTALPNAQLQPPPNPVFRVRASNVVGVNAGTYIRFVTEENNDTVALGDAKFEVSSVIDSIISVRIPAHLHAQLREWLTTRKVRWALAKDDVTPKDLFRLCAGTAADRAIVRKYCWADCDLVFYLFNKSDVLQGFIEMSSICCTPISFLVFRGQSIKLVSFLSKRCRAQGILLPDISGGAMDEAYEGALVIEPEIDIYQETPVSCLDFSSLYPSKMHSNNLSHDSKVWARSFDLDGNPRGPIEGRPDLDNLPGREYVTQTYDEYTLIRNPDKPTAAPKRVLTGRRTCRFIQADETGKGRALLPRILEELLAARKATRARAKTEPDAFMRSVLNQRQLGYKVTANSIYGGCGFKKGMFYEKDVAACTTSAGQMLLKYAKSVVEKCFSNVTVECPLDAGAEEAVKDGATPIDPTPSPPLPTAKMHISPKVIYGDTDSVFLILNLRDPVTRRKIVGKTALAATIRISKDIGKVATAFLKPPHDLEYEKTYSVFALLAKKRYFGILHEHDYRSGKMSSSGVCLNRRDNAPIVKDVYGSIQNHIQSPVSTLIDILDKQISALAKGQCDIRKLILSKSLRSTYVDPQKIAHKVLADRIAVRSPGNKPTPGDRIPFVYVVVPGARLQGDRIELPSFAKDTGMTIDYAHYITNQVMKPVQQVFSLIVERVWDAVGAPDVRRKAYRAKVDQIEVNRAGDSEAIARLTQNLRMKEIEHVLFKPHLDEMRHNRHELIENISDHMSLVRSEAVEQKPQVSRPRSVLLMSEAELHSHPNLVRLERRIGMDLHSPAAVAKRAKARAAKEVARVREEKKASAAAAKAAKDAAANEIKREKAELREMRLAEKESKQQNKPVPAKRPKKTAAEQELARTEALAAKARQAQVKLDKEREKAAVREQREKKREERQAEVERKKAVAAQAKAAKEQATMKRTIASIQSKHRPTLDTFAGWTASAT